MVNGYMPCQAGEPCCGPEGPCSQGKCHVSQAAMRLGLVLFVGVGVSGRCTPPWENLVGGLVEDALKELRYRQPGLSDTAAGAAQKWCCEEAGFDAPAQAEIARMLLGERLFAALHRRLYSHRREGGGPVGFEEVRDHCKVKASCGADDTFGYLREVAALCQSPRVRAVVTFNYDGLVEEAIAARDERKCIALNGTVLAPSEELEGKLPVYHVHGYVPRNQPAGEGVAPVLALARYLDSMRDPMGWETTTPLHLLRQHCCLFIGASMRDWNMLRLAQTAMQRRGHDDCYCVMAGKDLNRDCPGDAVVRAMVQATLLRSVGARLIVPGSQWQHVREFLWKLTDDLLKG